MATFNGNLADLTREYDAVVWNPGYGSHNVVAPAKSLRETTDAAVGSYGDQNPVALPGDSFSGDEADQYGFLDWFNRMHVQYAVLDLGNLISAQVREVEVFSTYFTDRALTTVTPTNDDGLVLAAPGAYPLTWLPFASKTFELTAGTDGPANIDANYDFQFDIGTIPMSVIGTRVILWAFHPDWRQPVLERLEWLTTVVRSYNGKEQRMRVRQAAGELGVHFQRARLGSERAGLGHVRLAGPGLGAAHLA